jgi:hypothetical protein
MSNYLKCVLHTVGAASLTCTILVASSASAEAQEIAKGKEDLSAQTFPESSRRVVYDSAAFQGHDLGVFRWDKGYLISFEIESFQGDLPNVSIFDATGRKAREATVWFPDSQRVLITSATVTFDGRILVSGVADKSDGTSAPFIGRTDLAGKLTDVIQTKEFAPTNVCGAPDGTVWSFGTPFWDEQTRGWKPGETLRHFDFQKGQLGGYVPQSVFGNKLPAPSAISEIRCTQDGVSVYSRPAGTYIEMSYASDTPQIYRVQNLAGLFLYGFASSGPRKVYGLISDRTNPQNKTLGIYSMLFDETNMTATWKACKNCIATPNEPGRIGTLFGIDGENLIVERNGDPLEREALHWVPVVDLVHQ